MEKLIAIINADMIGTKSILEEHVNWNEPDIYSEVEWNEILGCGIDEFASENAHIIVFYVLIMEDLSGNLFMVEG